MSPPTCFLNLFGVPIVRPTPWDFSHYGTTDTGSVLKTQHYDFLCERIKRKGEDGDQGANKTYMSAQPSVK